MCCGCTAVVVIAIITLCVLVSYGFVLFERFYVDGRAPTYRYEEEAADGWLDLHNERRQKYHGKYGGEYVALKWSDSVATEAHAWAQRLAKADCADYYHDPNTDMGENLAVIWGSHSIERVMNAWVEEEELDVDEPYSSGHGHMTQVLWRATKYVGCSRVTNDECHIYVCRYLRPGNCNRGKYTWLSDMMADDSPCGPFCPEEGCF